MVDDVDILGKIKFNELLHEHDLLKDLQIYSEIFEASRF